MNTMTTSVATGPSYQEGCALIERYIRAKDENRAHLIAATFHDTAQVHMEVQTSGISFPPLLNGSAEIAETLVQRFGCTYGNVYTFCLDFDPAASESAPDTLVCRWLVAMTAKTDGTARLGWGSYRWKFSRIPDDTQWKVECLTIQIAQMKTLSRRTGHDLISWASSHPYPFSSDALVLETLPGALLDHELSDFLR